MNNTCLSKNTKRLKSNIYTSECNNIIDKLNDILFTDLSNMSFYTYHLDNDIDKQNKIIQLESDVKKFMASSRWAYFNKDPRKKYFSLLRSIYKYMNYDVIRSTSSLSIDGKIINTQLYVIKKKE